MRTESKSEALTVPPGDSAALALRTWLQASRAACLSVARQLPDDPPWSLIFLCEAGWERLAFSFWLSLPLNGGKELWDPKVSACKTLWCWEPGSLSPPRT